GGELLVLDDLGARKMTDWAADTLFDVLNSRYCARRPTLVTTSFEDVPREVALETDSRRREEFLIERVGQRLRSRLLEMCVFVPMQAPPERGRRRPGTTLGALRRLERWARRRNAHGEGFRSARAPTRAGHRRVQRHRSGAGAAAGRGEVRPGAGGARRGQAAGA